MGVSSSSSRPFEVTSAARYLLASSQVIAIAMVLVTVGCSEQTRPAAPPDSSTTLTTTRTEASVLPTPPSEILREVIDSGDNGITNLAYQLWSTCETWLRAEPGLSSLSLQDRLHLLMGVDAAASQVAIIEPQVQPLADGATRLLDASVDDELWTTSERLTDRAWLTRGCSGFDWNDPESVQSLRTPPS
jgi:hypothetical protein